MIMTTRWHSKEDLPKKPRKYSGSSIPVLVQYRDYTADLEVLHYNFITNKFCFDQTDFTNEVLMWRYLPKKFKG